MFFLNLGYRWTLADPDQLDGVVHLASGSIAERFERSRLPELHRVLFDPQLYLAGLPVKDCAKACGRLATYKWFDVPGIETFDSGSMTQPEWELKVRTHVSKEWRGHAPKGAGVKASCAACVQFQSNLGVSSVILPCPLIEDRDDQLKTQCVWLDTALDVCDHLEVPQPLVATVALSESAISEPSFKPARFLDSIVDQFSARENLSGVYIVVAQHKADHPFKTNDVCQHAYLHLCRRFAEAGSETILTNFSDVFGLVCLSAGATGTATGTSQGLRRLSLAGFQDAGGGKAYPYFYSHAAAAEYATESDLDRLRANRLHRRVRDVTKFSKPLMDALDDGRSASDVPTWAESQNNTQTAHKHFLARMKSEVGRLVSRSPKQRQTDTSDWLEQAEANHLFIQKRLDPPRPPLKGVRIRADSWLELLDGAAPHSTSSE